MLGMAELHALAADLETVLVGGEPSDPSIVYLENRVNVMCRAIEKAFGLSPAPEAGSRDSAVAEVAAINDLPLPDEPLPLCIERVITMLEAADGDCDQAILVAFEMLDGSPWLPHLLKALAHTRNFDFNSARAVFFPAHAPAGDSGND